MAKRNEFLPLVNMFDLVLDVAMLVRVRVDTMTAKAMLAINKENRLVRRNAVEYLKRQISSGDWRDDHPQPVVFSTAGRLIDGQHRLLAIAEMDIPAEKALIVRVETGADDSIREYLDTGIPRTLYDRVAFVHDPKVNKVIAQLCNYHAQNVVFRKRPTPEEARSFFLAHKEAALFVARNKRNDKGTGAMSVAYAALEYYEIDSAKAEEFYRALNQPDSEIQQARMLRDWLLRTVLFSPTHKGGTARRDIYTRAVGCMKAHLQGRDIKVVRAAEW